MEKNESPEKNRACFSIPSGNFGNITALLRTKNGFAVKRLIAANNRNDVFFDFLRTGQYRPRPSVATLANAMDVGDPSNFARVLDLFDLPMRLCVAIYAAPVLMTDRLQRLSPLCIKRPVI